MQPTRTELAVLNNVHWYEAMFDAHGLAHESDGKVWLSHAHPPPFHSNLVVRSPEVSRSLLESYVRDLERMPPSAHWSLKDSYARLDLSPQGFAPLFEAQWIWRDPVELQAPPVPASLDWERVATASALKDWERVWWGDSKNESQTRGSPQFPPRLLSSPEHIFLAGKLDGRVVAGGILNRSPGVVGVSNVFFDPTFAHEVWDTLAAHGSTAFPHTPLVGYERGADLQLARRAGFKPIGPLRVWQRTPGSDGPSPHGG